jgi:hypothetical protein
MAQKIAVGWLAAARNTSLRRLAHLQQRCAELLLFRGA